MDFAHPPSFKASPDPAAPNVAPLPAQVAIRKDARPTNGFVPAINFAGRKMWVSTAFLTPYHSDSNPNARCTAVKFTDNTYGFTYGQ